MSGQISEGGQSKRRPPRGDTQSPQSAGSPPAETFAEPQYLKRLVQEKIPIVVRLRDNEEFAGTLEYYDANFIRLTRRHEPNLFIYKHEIKYLSEQPDPKS